MHRAYASYYTHAAATEKSARHDSSEEAGFLRKAFAATRDAYLTQRFGYSGQHRNPMLAFLAHLHPAGTDSFSVEAMFLQRPAPGSRLLEIGCGDGRMLARMKSRGWETEGVEFDPKCVDQVRAAEIPCHSGDLREVSLPANKYDAIYMGNVIEHVYEPRSFLRECFRILRPNGQLVILTPNTESWGHRHFKQDWRGLEPPRHLQIFNLRNLSRAVQDAGFSLRTARTSSRGAWYILGTSARIRETRRQDSAAIQPTALPFSPRGLIYSAVGRAAKTLRSTAGDELLLIACKP
jgi:2-polyprenyl-3-methyl-5-hydroxy-6-metoxy-1,4-benzoquinol methylase